MQFGIFSVSDITRDPTTGYTPTEKERIDAIVTIAKHAEDIGLDVFAIGEHHNPPFFSSSPTTTLAYIGAQTKRILLSTSTTLITTNDPVKIVRCPGSPWCTRWRACGTHARRPLPPSKRRDHGRERA